MKKISRRSFIKSGTYATIGVCLSPIVLTGTEAHTLPQPRGAATTFSPFPQKTPGIRERKFDNLVIISKDSQHLELNDTGALLWEHVDGSKSVHHLAEIVAKAYNIDHEAARKDSQIFINALVDKSFLTLPKNGPCYQLPG